MSALRSDDDADFCSVASRDVALTPQERLVLAVLETNRGRVVGRAELARHSGMTGLSARRCDSVIGGLRRRLGTDAIVTVRSRGWMLSER